MRIKLPNGEIWHLALSLSSAPDFCAVKYFHAFSVLSPERAAEEIKRGWDDLEALYAERGDNAEFPFRKTSELIKVENFAKWCVKHAGYQSKIVVADRADGWVGSNLLTQQPKLFRTKRSQARIAPTIWCCTETRAFKNYNSGNDVIELSIWCGFKEPPKIT